MEKRCIEIIFEVGTIIYIPCTFIPHNNNYYWNLKYFFDCLINVDVTVALI